MNDSLEVNTVCACVLKLIENRPSLLGKSKKEKYEEKKIVFIGNNDDQSRHLSRNNS